MKRLRLPRPEPWAWIVFGVALLARLAFWALADQPLVYTHQYHYFTNGLRIATDPHPFHYLLTSDEWRLWDQYWTIAPLYYPFEALVFALFGPHLEPLRLTQCVMGALTAVLTGMLGRELAGRLGWWAGLAYAVAGYGVELPTWTITENLHNVLLMVSVILLLRGARQHRLRPTVWGALVLGLSALARSVSSAFLPLAAAWRWWAEPPSGRWWARRWKPALVLFACGLLPILPWSARNVFVMHDWVPIETTGYENLWYANHFTDPERFRRQADIVHSQPTPALQRAMAWHFALRGMRREPGQFVDKVRANFWHFFRLEGLHGLLIIERSLETWRHVFYVVLEDAPIVLLMPFFVAWLLAGPRTPAWGFVVLWVAYYLLMEVVVFLNEVPRHRTGFMPFFFAAAVAGVVLCRNSAARRRPLFSVGLLAGLWLAVALVWPYPAPAWRAMAAQRALRPVSAAIEHGDFPAAERLVADATARAPRSPRPWLDYGRKLAFASQPALAAVAYDRGASLASVANWRALLARPRLLRESGQTEPASQALSKADQLSWDADPWMALEIAWQELPPPRTDEIRLAQDDYGAVRGFLYPRGLDPSLWRHRLEWNKYEIWGGPQPPPGPHRWTRHRAWLRLIPTDPAPAHDVTLYMGSPFPSPIAAPEVTVRAGDGPPTRFVLGPEVRPYVVRTSTPTGQPLLVRIDAPTWCRVGEPADQGVRVDRLTVTPVR